MDERSFIERKRESWQALSDALEQARTLGPNRLPPDRLKALGAQYRAVVSDLSYVRSQAGSDRLIVYLNELAGRAHGVIYSAKPARARGLLAFFTTEFPSLFRSTFRYTLIAALIFFGAWAIPATNPEIRDSLIPQEIQAPTKGTPSPLSGVDPSMLSSFIMTNNIKEGILAFIGGVTAGTMTVFQMARNGMFIGAVAAKAAPAMGPLRFWALILPHGIIELTAIFICGGAGLIIGCSMIAPGNLRRADAMRKAGARAVRLFAGAVAMFVIAGTIEGFVTPSPLPETFKLAFAALTALALLYYFAFAGSAGASPSQAS